MTSLSARIISRTHALDRALACLVERRYALRHDLVRARGLDHAHDLDFARALTVAECYSRKLSSHLPRALDNAVDVADAIDIARGGDLARALDVAHAFDLVRGLERACNTLARANAYSELSRDLDRTLAHDGGLLDAFERARGTQGPVRGRLVRPLLAAAARVVPARDRARYREEFRGEAAEIGQSGGGRFAQLAYSARVTLSAVRLRAALASARRRGALS